MAKVRKAKKLFVFGIALVDWMIGFAFPLLVYANGRGAWASEVELRDLLDIIFTVPLVALFGPTLISFVYLIIHFVLNDKFPSIKLIPCDNNLKFNTFLCLTSPVITTLCIYEVMTDRPMTVAYLITVIIILIIYLCLALWMPLEVQWALEAIDRFERKLPDLVNYYSLRAQMEDDLEVYLQIKCAGISPDDYVMQKIKEIQIREKS